MPRRKRLEWDTKVGPASIIGIVQLVGLIVGLGVLYGTFSTRLDHVSASQTEFKTTISDVQRTGVRRDEKVATQGERIGKIETSVGFIGSAIQRIEQAIAK